ncbi:MAG: FeoB-associated Cys-rich membrane protein [Oscillospiraceae bacterium]|nr:FeoB-associated Cys-rich membrane protein [Oscillospiraceae bacterium]
MFLWIRENLATVVICAILVLMVAAILVRMVKNKRKGRSSCGCGCADCAMQNSCHHHS